ncbi:MAG: galactose-1-phosphate uridylyltransferase [Candidatus Omnitrophica bacterium]|nr:galactose-1-phosphate uridylyltransferase [Candidatus Omnitrophota bacterium]
MTQLRRDPVVGRWVIVEDEKNALGPEHYEKEDHSLKERAICQFCPGRENQTPPEVDAIREHGSHPNSSGWFARVVSNKFPALRIEGELNKRGSGVYDISNGIGAHEVLIETPDHDKNLADLSVEEVERVIRLYQNRSNSLARDKRFKYIMIFKNYGRSAGASVEHAHSQVIALPMIPKYVAQELEGAEEYYQRRGKCIFCDMLRQEEEEQERIFAQNEGFLAFCPFVPRYPFETWILPKEHLFEFGEMTEKGRWQLAEVLKDVLLRIKKVLQDPSYNFYLHVAPINFDKKFGFYHWHIEIVPKLTREAGYEWGSGFYVVRTPPRLAAKYLREASNQ